MAFVLWFLTSVLAISQNQERKLMDRLLKPDANRQSDFQNKVFEKSAGFVTNTAAMGEKSFASRSFAMTKEFETTRRFFGVKNPWFGQKTYETKIASIFTKSSLSNIEKEIPVRRAEVASFYNSEKQMPLGTKVVPIRDYPFQGQSQGMINEITSKSKKQMTIDEVRDMLNKPR